MRYSLYIVTGVTVVALFYFGIVNREQPKSSTLPQIEQATNTPMGNWETITNDQPPVSLKITPLELGPDAKIWKFAVVFDAHSGSLDDDPMTVVMLTDDKGTAYPTTAWEGPGPGGHHREGILMFNPIQPFPKYVELRVKNVGGVPERSFRWDTK